jgi:hypothetical protein
VGRERGGPAGAGASKSAELSMMIEEEEPEEGAG